MRKTVPAMLHRLREDRRGATAVVFALAAVSVLGLVGLGTEGGTWYLERRHGQNAADAAAIAGALALASGSTNSAAVTSATDVARQNNYTNGTNGGGVTSVAITNVTVGGSPGIQAVVTRAPPRLFSGLFIGTNPAISETAVALVSANNGNACLLAGAGGLNFAGSTLINASNCSLASNKTGPNSIAFGGNKATVSNGTLNAAGGCSNCGNSAGYLTYQPKTTNPYASIYNMDTNSGMTMPNFSGSHCLAIPTVGVSTTLAPWTASAPNAYCGNNGNSDKLNTSTGNVLNFVTGTYFFQNVSLVFNGGTVNCVGCTPGGAGVTIILTGSNANKIGSIDISGNATVNLNAPVTNSWCHSAGSGCSPATAFDGLLFYMDKVANVTNGNGNAPVKLSGNGNVHLTGGMYFPTVNVTYSGDVSATNTAVACTEIIGYQFNITGNSTLNIAGCAADGTNVAQTKSVRLWQ